MISGTCPGNNFSAMPGKLFLIPVPVYFDYTDKTAVFFIDPIIHRLKTFIVEDVKTARRILIRAGYSLDIHETRFLVYNEHSKSHEVKALIDNCLEGEDIGLMSESGMPCIADPGSLVVKMAHSLGIRVIPLSGDSSVNLALMGSGFNGQRFCFHGYLPIEKQTRIKTLKELEQHIFQSDQTQIFIETPYRNQQLFDIIIQVLSGSTWLCIASSLKSPEESIESKSIAEWRKSKHEMKKNPAVFLLYK